MILRKMAAGIVLTLCLTAALAAFFPPKAMAMADKADVIVSVVSTFYKS